MPSVLVPRRGGCPHRGAAWEWVLGRYAERFPDWQVLVGRCPVDEPWCKARAVMAAAQLAESEIVLVADADVWGEGIAEAVEAVESGEPWAMPHRGVFRLSGAATDEVLAGQPIREDLPIDPAESRGPYLGTAGGGVVVLRRETLREIPLDPRFTGWGQEDASWGIALWCLLGRPYRVKLPLYHLWHPPQERLTRQKGSSEGWALYRRYKAARNDPSRMRSLIEEAHDAFATHHPPLHDRLSHADR